MKTPQDIMLADYQNQVGYSDEKSRQAWLFWTSVVDKAIKETT